MYITDRELKALQPCKGQWKLIKKTFHGRKEITRENIGKAFDADINLWWYVEEAWPQYVDELQRKLRNISNTYHAYFDITSYYSDLYVAYRLSWRAEERLAYQNLFDKIVKENQK